MRLYVHVASNIRSHIYVTEKRNEIKNIKKNQQQKERREQISVNICEIE